jgi:hypothetical protein
MPAAGRMTAPARRGMAPAPAAESDAETRAKRAIAEIMVKRVRLWRRLIQNGINQKIAAHLVRVSPSALWKWRHAMERSGVDALLVRIQRPAVTLTRLVHRQAHLDQIARILDLQPASLGGGRVPLSARCHYDSKCGEIRLTISLARLP